MNEEIIELLNQIKSGTTICGIFLFFILILVISYFFGAFLEDFQKHRDIEKAKEQNKLKEEIVKDITDYYDSTKENKK